VQAVARSGRGVLDGRTALVTGSARGMGAATAVGFAQEGANVVVHYQGQRERAEQVAEQVRGLGVRATTVQGDVADPDDVRRIMEDVRAFLGAAETLDILVNNAGIYPPGDLETLDVAEWDRVMAVNVRGAFLCTQAALPLLKASAAGRVINVSSNTVFKGSRHMVHYVTSKAAVIGLTRALVHELADHGITVNCFVPSIVSTETSDTLYPGMAEKIVQAQAVKELQRPEDLVGLLVFLASDGARFVTGQTITIDGGITPR
jgi:3-oxoacyl-[acyl-carrier protein] reductase